MADSAYTMFIRSLFVFPAIFLFWFSGNCQEKEKTITLAGYLTTMQSSTFDSLSGPFLNENLIHNRLNFKVYLNEKMTFAAEFRNRLFTGDMVKYGRPYAGLIGDDDGVVDMSWNIVEEQSFLLNTTIDRLWFDLHYDKIQLTAGRQRINWGQALVWNPNDIFNAYSYFDFDYIERPGSDAIRLQLFPSSTSAAEFALKAGHENEVTAAALYRFSLWNYDIQFLAGYMNSKDVVGGAGWSGSVGSMSFRGEGTWFIPKNDSAGNESTLLVTAGLDRIFNDNSMAQVQMMYCNNPLELNNYGSFYSGSFSSKDLAFSEFTAFGQFTWAVTPLLNLTLAAMWFPDLDGYYAGPSVECSLAQNLGFSFIWQHFDAKIDGNRSKINQVFLRLKYNF
ncbi:MAG: hypothetical protein AB9834_16640 [Lentimicrobium sp.]